MTTHAQLAELARDAVAQACYVCRQVQRAQGEILRLIKDDNSPVSVADFASQAIIGHALRGALGKDVILVGEEDSATLRKDESSPLRDAVLAAVREVWPDCTEDDMLGAIDVGAGDTHHQAFWTLDPVDGTKGFLRNQQYAIALAFVERGAPVIGVLGCPNLARDFSAPLDEPDPHGTIYVAARGTGLWEYPADKPHEKGTEIKRVVHERDQPVSICASVEKAHSSEPAMDRVIEHLREQGVAIAEPTRLDSQAKYAVVARGQGDAYIRLPTKKGYVERIWDHAAGTIVASEGGAFVTDIFGHVLDFSTGRGLEKNKGIVCAPARLHGMIIEAIQSLELHRA
ncbi:MAG: 3'(2'),5'-bisphosphate nucleotidase [Phycisphaerales bacterium]|jgi:3'(2'), 5'-bisphosphate nucleotidase|nr:3'(2'),5'-bisphosphate nucleotidase [Phycisphaerales bacterium]